MSDISNPEPPPYTLPPPATPQNIQMLRQPAENATIATASDFLAARQRGEAITLPVSGLTIKARRVGVDSFAAQGQIPNSLLKLMASGIEAVDKGDTGKEEAIEEFGKSFMGGISSGDIDMMELMGLIDNAVVQAMVSPRCYPNVQHEDDRVEGRLYVEDIDVNDRMFIFNWAIDSVAGDALKPFR